MWMRRRCAWYAARLFVLQNRGEETTGSTRPPSRLVRGRCGCEASKSPTPWETRDTAQAQKKDERSEGRDEEEAEEEAGE